MPLRTYLLAAKLMLGVLTFFCPEGRAETGRLMVITDMEPDDRMAIHLLAANVPETDFLFFGTTVMNAARKQALGRLMLDQIGLGNVPVHQGTGGEAGSYPNLSATRPAREYTHEGQGILTEAKLAELEAAPKSSLDLQKAIFEGLSRANDGEVEILMLAPPVDLVEVLEKNPSLKRKIKQIFVMGGWAESQSPTGETVLRTTYNWNMDPAGSHASNRLMAMKDVPMTVFSYHAIKKAFPTRSVNPGNFPKVWSAIDAAQASMPSLVHSSRVGGSWDGHVLENLPPELPPTHPLKAALVEHGGRQFAPADVLAVLGFLNEKLIASSRPVSIAIDESDIDPKTGIRIRVTDDQGSKIRIVESLDTDVFEKDLIEAFRSLPAITRRRLTEFPRRELPARFCRLFGQLVSGLIPADPQKPQP